MTRFAARIAYDGTAYQGFQRQASAPTIQRELETALATIARRAVRVTGAGRTDAGVHATGQVIAFDLGWKHDAASLRNALNANLPPDIAALKVWEAAPGFHPRFDASARRYVYRLYVADVRNPLLSRSAWHLTRALDAEAISASAEHLVGTHDFTSFGTPPQGENSVRTVSEARWEAGADGQHMFTITANAFLFRMVRSIVATLALVGQHVMTTEEFRGILAARRRGLAAAPAPPQGLTLVEVRYSND